MMLGKHGVPRDECLELVHYVKEDCAHLSFDGLMTIGRMNHHPDVSGPNPDFVVMYVWCMWCNGLSFKVLDFINFVTTLQSLVECGKKVQSALQLPGRIELSMGMSADYEHAVSCHGNHLTC